MSITKLASQVPAPMAPSGFVSLADAYDASPPATFEVPQFSNGDIEDVVPKLNKLAQFCELIGRYGAIGVYGIGYGLGLTHVSGLTVAVAQGHAYVGSIIEFAADSLTMSDNATNYIWAKRDGTFEVIADDTDPPAQDSVYIGIVVTASGTISGSVDYSGVIYLKGTMALRETADPDFPSDSPPVGVTLYTKTLDGTWKWDGTRHVHVGGSYAESGVISIAMSDANLTLSADQYKYRIIVLTGTLTADRDIVFPNVKHPWLIVNTTTGGFKIKPKVSGQTGVSVANGYAVWVYGNGTDMKPGTLTTEFMDGTIEASAEAA